MTSTRLLFVLVAGCCLLRPSLLPAADATPPFEMEKHYSADVIISTEGHGDITSKAFVDGDKMRSDAKANGKSISMIMRKDLKKFYQLMPEQKMAMEMPYDSHNGSAASFGPQGKFELLGPGTVDGVACTEYKVTPEKGKEIYFFWMDTAKKIPVKMTDERGTFMVTWKNFKAGPQDAALFEVPSDYTIMPMPSMPGLPPQGDTNEPAKPHF